MTTTPLDAVFEPTWVDRYLLLAERYEPSAYAACHYACAPAAGRQRVVLVERFAPWVHTDIVFSVGYRLYPEPPNLAEQFLERARLVARIRHPNCVAVLDAGLDDEGLPYRVVEYHEGAPLLALLKEASRRGAVLPVRLAIRIVVDACRGLHAAHESVDEEGNRLGVTLAVLDYFSILVGADGTTRVRHLGIPRGKQANRQLVSYLAPEQTRRNYDETDRRADVFRLGIIAWELCAGRRLFAGYDDRERLDAILGGKVSPVRSWQTEFPAALDAVVLKALALDPADRYQSCADFADALEDAIVESGGLVHEGEVARHVQAIYGPQLAQERAACDAVLAAAPPLEGGERVDGPRFELTSPYRGGAPSGERPAEEPSNARSAATLVSDVPSGPVQPRTPRRRVAGTPRALAATCVVLVGLGAAMLALGTVRGLVGGVLCASLALALLWGLVRRG